MLDEVVGDERAPRDFRAKFPDDVLQENLAGQLWFGAEVRTQGVPPGRRRAWREDRRALGVPSFVSVRFVAEAKPRGMLYPVY